MKEYKGIGGGKVIIDGDKLHIKQMFVKDDFTFGDIEMILLNEHNAFRFSVDIRIKPEKMMHKREMERAIPFSIIFKSKESAQELYDAIYEKAPHTTPESIKNAAEAEKQELDDELGVDKVIFVFHFATAKRKWYCSYDPNREVFDFDDVIDAWTDTYSTSSSETSGKRSGIGRAVVGGLVAGPTGALVGAVTGKNTEETVTNTTNTTVLYIKIKQYPDEIMTYNIPSQGQAERIVDMLTSTPEVSQPQIDTTEELRKYKGLLDDGIITQDEFDSKKKQLLNL